jgi:hypothetical protein
MLEVLLLLIALDLGPVMVEVQDKNLHQRWLQKMLGKLKEKQV